MNLQKNKLSLVMKTTITLALVLSLILISINVFSAIYTKSIVSNKVQNQLQERLHQINDTLVTYDELLKTTADSLYETFETQFSNIEINLNKKINVNGVQTPEISDNGITLNNNTQYVDSLSILRGSTATVFAKMGDDFVRVTTSLKRPDGSRTIGTFLGTKSPAYEHIMNGKKYFGTAHLFGSDYMAVYNPIMKNGKVIGILYVGYNYTKSFIELKRKLKSLKVGNSGYLYILSTKLKNKGQYILHPTKEGKNIFKQDVDSSLVANIFKSSKGSIDYEWVNPKTSDTKTKTVIFENYDDRGWKLVLGTTKQEFLQESTKFTWILACISLASIIIVSIIILLIIKKLVIKPLHSLQNGLDKFFRFLNKETTEIQKININSGDEIGLMSNLINKNIEHIGNNIVVDNKLIEDTVNVANKVKDGHLDQRITQNSNDPLLNDLKNVVNNMLEHMQKNILNVQNVLTDYTTFNYKSKVETSSIQADMKKLYEDLNLLGDATTKMLYDNLKTGHTLKNNSNKLSDITHQLSDSSNVQAASLEQTAASLEELTESMNNNESSMTQMSSNATSLQNAILNGQQLANKTASSMDLINEQTNSIADAITIIDQIAFQTNILSLNAAVEAATAGEAGKGFAVVAQEVRNLASRSADAAREIKDLVENATTKANEGKAIANEMITGYEDLNDNVHKTADIIEDVINNFKEQVRGMGQINDAVASLDKVTQDNAMIASNANKIASDTDIVAEEIVNNTSSKEFYGKENI